MFKIIQKLRNKYYKYYNRKLFQSVKCDINSIFIGPNCNTNFTIKSPEKLSIGIGTAINGYCFINAYGGVRIGIYCHIGKGLTIFSHNHNYHSYKSIPYDNTNIVKPVVIEDFVWCGANVTIVPGVTVGEGAVIGSGSVVTKNVPKGAVVGGNPAIVIKYRDMELYEKLKQEGKFH